mmetsp:Transcript_126102/g.223332  ORF Transcript_126102/g.223332 Transcript_126102/m.223332 type:complete len:165 (-) Transcript_126102:155-649(-)
MPEVVQATVVSPAPNSAPSNVPMGAVQMGEVVDPDSKGGRPMAPVQATVVQQPVMGQTVVGQPVVVGGVPGAYTTGVYTGSATGGYPAEDPTLLAIVACICCCWCIGIWAIIKAQQVNQANMTGNYEEAHRRRKEAMQWIYVTVGVGLVFTAIQIVLRISMQDQ